MTHDRLEILTLGSAPSSGDAPHLLGSMASDDLNVNLMRFTGDGGIEEELAAGQATIIPKGVARSIRCNGERFAYLTCHGQRRGMMPTVGKR